MSKHLDIKIYGQVQGVFFRYSAKDKADELGITGFARNEADGAVRIEVEGQEDKLKEFLDWCRQGPEMAMVEKVEFAYQPIIKNFKNFSVE